MKISIINCSAPVYNLAAQRMLARYQKEGHEVSITSRPDSSRGQIDLALFSAIFTWDLPQLVHEVKSLINSSPFTVVEIGGPAPTAMPEFIYRETNIRPHVGLDSRFEHVPGEFKATFTSRGCPRHCDFCLVPTLEGQKIKEYSDFNVPVGKNPYVCDNNILCTSWQHQQDVVEKLKCVKYLDINSGFDARIFSKDPERYYQLYSQLQLECWRFACDTSDQKELVKHCVDFLHTKGVSYRETIVFCLIGGPNTNFQECRERLQYLINIGCSPYPQRYRPLDALQREYVPIGWNPGDLDVLFNYYGVPQIWRSCTWEDFLKERETGALQKEMETRHNAFIAEVNSELSKLLPELGFKHGVKLVREKLLVTFPNSDRVEVIRYRHKMKDFQSPNTVNRENRSRPFAARWAFCHYVDLGGELTIYDSPSELAGTLGLKVSGHNTMLDVFGHRKIMLDGSECKMEFQVAGDASRKDLGMEVKRIK